MLRIVIIFIFIGYGLQSKAQVKANDSLFNHFNRHNKVDSLYLYQSFKWKNNEFELINVEKMEPWTFELASKGGLVNISTRYSVEDFFYKGETMNTMVIKLDTNKEVYHQMSNVYKYEEQAKGIETYFYFFPDQPFMIYRLIIDKKRKDILLYFISPKD